MSFRREPLGQKVVPCVSPAIRRAAMGETCTLQLECCIGGTETTVFAHLRFPGDGIGRKPPDYSGVMACERCHAALDGRDGLGWMCGDADKLRAWRLTMDRLYARGMIVTKEIGK